MAFTFDPNLTTDRDWIRADLGDTDEATALLSDEQIAAVLSAEGGSRHQAKLCLAAQMEAWIAQQPVRINVTTGESYDLSQRLVPLSPLAAAWRALEAARAAAAEATAEIPRAAASVRATAVW